jgi:hypothetical protein
MSNHFHLLCEVPQAQELSEAELLDRIQAGNGPARRQALDQQLAHLRQEPDGADQIQRLLQPYRNRLFDLSSFVKELKGRLRVGTGQISAGACLSYYTFIFCCV